MNQEAETRQGCSQSYLLCSKIFLSKLMLKRIFWKMLLQKLSWKLICGKMLFAIALVVCQAPIEDVLREAVVDKDVVSKLLLKAKHVSKLSCLKRLCKHQVLSSSCARSKLTFLCSKLSRSKLQAGFGKLSAELLLKLKHC